MSHPEPAFGRFRGHRHRLAALAAVGLREIGLAFQATIRCLPVAVPCGVVSASPLIHLGEAVLQAMA